MRDYKEMSRDVVPVSRRLLIFLFCLFVLFVGLKIFTPPSELIQRLDSPDGKWQAQILRREEARSFFAIQLRAADDWRWRTIYTSPSFDLDYSIDQGERLSWTNETTLLFTMHNKILYQKALTE